METLDTCIRQNSNRICYMILPRGIRNEALDLEALSEKCSVSIVQVNGVDWNDDLTPWPAHGVFKKAKPFGGKADAFLGQLVDTCLPDIEGSLCLDEGVERTLLGVSLSGMFAVWAGFSTDVFTNIISISGSMWYDGFAEWVATHRMSPCVRKVCMLLGVREKDTKEARMANVHADTAAVAKSLAVNSHAEVIFETVEGTHFSPVMPRISRAFEVVYGG